MNIENLYSLYQNYPKITTDSRNISSGCIYFALYGDKFDGNVFADDAIKQGAAYAIIDNAKYESGEKTILVDDCLKTLQQLAQYHRRKFKGPVIAITGTNGKTTTKELIKAVLSSKHNTLATSGNLNNHIGVPLTLLSISNDTNIAVIEMGASHPLEIKFLCEIAEPTHGIITNIGKAHLEGFGGFDGVIKTKKELYDYLSNHNCPVFFNADNTLLTDILASSKSEKISYGFTKSSQCSGTIINGDGYLRMQLTDNNALNNNSITINSKLTGSYNAENILAACCIGLYFGVSLELSAIAIENYTPTNNRSQLKNTSKNKLLIDCYNANPSSTEAALKHFADSNAPIKTIILGDMLELGEEALIEHIRMLEMAKNIADTVVIVVGEIYQKLAPDFGFKSFSKINELVDWIKLNPINNNYILIKGSRGIQLEKVIEFL